MTLDITFLSNEEQKEYLKDWFLSRYEDPVHSCPYESSEGGYIYIWGGPFEASDILQGHFDLDEEIIDEVVNELEKECSEWSKIPTEENYDFPVNSKFFEAFIESIDSTQKLLQLEVDKTSKSHFYQLLYASVIIAIESFLSDAFITTVLSSEEYQRKLLETDPKFKKKTLTMNDFFERQKNIKKYIETYLKSEVMWHNLQKVSKMYKSVFDISFNDSEATIKDIYKAICVRHDIVHRNGKKKDGHNHCLSKHSVISLIEEISCLAKWIEEQLPELPSYGEEKDLVDCEKNLRQETAKDIEEGYFYS
jgi:hypothetical protein